MVSSDEASRSSSPCPLGSTGILDASEGQRREDSSGKAVRSATATLFSLSFACE